MSNNISYKINFNIIGDTKSVLEKYIIDSLFNIVWLKREHIDIPTAQYCDNIRELKRKYHGQTYMFYSFKIVNDKITLCDDNEDNDGIILVSKRDARERNHILKYDKIKNVKDYVNDEIEKFVNFINCFLTSSPICCSCEILDKNNNVLDNISDIIATNEDEMKRSIFNKTEIIEKEFDDFINMTNFRFDFK